MQIKKVYFLFFLPLFVLNLIGCRKQQLPLEATDPPMDTLSQQATPTSIPFTPTKTPTPISSPTKTLTSTPIPPIGERLSSLDAQEDQIHFLAYRHDCVLPVSFVLPSNDSDCTTLGIITENIILFPDIAGFQLLRVGYLIEDGMPISAAFLEETSIKVFEYDLQVNFETSEPLQVAELLMDPGQPNLLFTDIELGALQEKGITVFHIVVIGFDRQVYRFDQVAFDQQDHQAFIEGSVDDQETEHQQEPTTLPIIPSVTNTPLPPPPTYTPLPPPTRTPSPSLTHTPPPPPTHTQPPSPTVTRVTPTGTESRPTATNTHPPPNATPQTSPTATRTPWRPPTPTCRPG